MELVTSFAVETVAGLVGVFAGVILALWIERRRTERQAARHKTALQEDLVQSRKLVLSSVVKNTSEAKRLRRALAEEDDPYLFQVSFELAVWESGDGVSWERMNVGSPLTSLFPSRLAGAVGGPGVVVVGSSADGPFAWLGFIP